MQLPDSRFRSRSRDSGLFLLSNSPRFRTPCSQTRTGIYRLCAGVGWGGVLTYRVTHKTTHYGHTCDAKMPIFLLSWTNPYAQHRKEPSSTAQAHPALSKLLTCRLWCSTKPEGRKKKLLLLKEIVTRYWAYTEQVKPPRGDYEALLQQGWGWGWTAPFKEYNKTKSNLNMQMWNQWSEAAQL